MLLVFGKEVTTYTEELVLAELNKSTFCKVLERLNAVYELSFSYPLYEEGSEYLQVFNQIKVEDQIFRIYHVNRDSKSHLLNVNARHIFYDLSFFVIDDLRIRDKTCLEAMTMAIEELDLPGDFDYTLSSDITNEETLYLIRRTGTEALLQIADRFRGQLKRDNRFIEIKEFQEGSPVATVRYAENLIGINETLNIDKVVSRIYPVGANGLRLPERYLDYEGEQSELPTYPISKVVNFPRAETEEYLREIALDYLNNHAVLERNYQIDCILLEEEAQESGYAVYEDLLQVSVGDIVIVEHELLDINIQTQVLSVERDLLLAYNTKIELGRPLYGLEDYLYQTKDNLETEIANSVSRLSIFNKGFSVQEWAELVMEYVNLILGGTIVDVNTTLLLYTSVSWHGGKHRKLLKEVCEVLKEVSPDWIGKEDTTRFYVDLPLTIIKQKKITIVNFAYDYIDKYIRDTVGLIIGSNRLVNRINTAYEENYGSGQIASRPADTMETAFGGIFKEGTSEYNCASYILKRLNDDVGNLSHLYLEIGGGSSGAIGAINTLYAKLSGRDMTLSTDDPDNDLGRDGDLWFKFEEEEEE